MQNTLVAKQAIVATLAKKKGGNFDQSEPSIPFAAGVSVINCCYAARAVCLAVNVTGRAELRNTSMTSLGIIEDIIDEKMGTSAIDCW